MRKSEGMQCVRCRRIAQPAKLRFQGHTLDGWKCKCGEEYFEPLQANRILTLNKLKHQEFHAKLGRIRSNLIVRIPKAVEQGLGLTSGEEVTLKVKGKKIEITT